jgi:hypothetical protein
LVRAVVTSTAGSVTTDAAELTVAPALPTITIPTAVTADERGRAVFTVTADGDPSPALQWQRSTDGGAAWTDIAGATQATRTLDDVRPQDDGLLVRAVATNAAGSVASDAAALRVVPAASASAGSAAGPTAGGSAATGASTTAPPAGLARTGAELGGLAALCVALVLSGAGELPLVRRVRLS